GVYLITWEPRPGRTDAERNCISTIRPAGQDYAAAAETLAWLVREMRSRRLSGVSLKDERAAAATLAGPS
ncbi:MAG: ethanolamine ammonia-lyase light chain EutC, partial [Acetobacteraceae bacterium]